MLGIPTSFWAKLETRDNQVIRWHSLPDHSADVAACFHVLLALPVLNRRLSALAGCRQFDAEQIARLTVIAALHDIGKFNIGFQNKAFKGARFRCGHVREVLAAFGTIEGAAIGAAIGFEELQQWGADADATINLLVTALAHHGRPYGFGEGTGIRHRRDIWRSSGSLDPIAGITDLAARVRQWLPRAFVTGASPLPNTAGLQHGFNGLLTLADWLGSHQGFFDYEAHADAERFEWAMSRARHALREIGLDTRGYRTALGASPPTFDCVSPHPPNSMQYALARLPASESVSTTTILESETGSGKTEAALARFLALFHSGAVDGLYFALPTRSAATQMHRRICAAVTRAFPIGARPPVVLAVPGYLRVDDRTGVPQLPHFAVLWNDDDRERWRYRGWAAERPKRYLAGAVVVGTIDQVLLSTLAVPHAHLRAAPLLRHLLVVDEVHASDAYMTRLLEAVLARQRRAGGHALLMSATLGATARDRLMDPERRVAVAPLEEACAVPYPIVVHGSAHTDGTGLETPFTIQRVTLAAEQTRTVGVRLLPLSAQPQAIAERALAAARQGARVLVLRNTVRDCVETQQALEGSASADDADSLFQCAGVPAPHHARYATDDREALDDALESRFGSVAPRGGCIAVTTQTVQQSLDLDADLLLTDLCPMDVLLQRIGRLHRHRHRDPIRPTEYSKPVVEVLVPATRDLGRMIRRPGGASGPHGLGTVYEDLTILEASWRLLESLVDRAIEVPRMCRALVEGATHPDALAQIEAELGDPWPLHAQHRRGVFFAHRRLATLNVVDWTRGFFEPENRFPTDLDERICTRLGQDDRLIGFDEPFVGPFGRTVRELPLPAHLARGIAPDAVPLDITRGSGYISFSLGPHRLVYDRLGLRICAANADDDRADA